MAHAAVDWIVGIDLAQGGSDYTAMVVTERVLPPGKPAEYSVIHIDRYRDRLAPEIIPTRSLELWQELNFRYQERMKASYGYLPPTPVEAKVRFAVDATGVGPFGVFPLVDAGFHPFSILIHGGNAVTHPDEDTYHIPKRDLAGVINVLLGTRRLTIAEGLPETRVLRAELENFKVKINLRGHDSYAAGTSEKWRDGEHDDLVLALAIACWIGEFDVEDQGFIADDVLKAFVWTHEQRMTLAARGIE